MDKGEAIRELTSYLEGGGYTISNYTGTLIGNNNKCTLTNIIIDSPVTYVPTTNGNKFAPKGTATRAALAAMLMRFDNIARNQ